MEVSINNLTDENLIAKITIEMEDTILHSSKHINYKDRLDSKNIKSINIVLLEDKR